MWGHLQSYKENSVGLKEKQTAFWQGPIIRIRLRSAEKWRKTPRIGHSNPVRQPHDRRVFSTLLNPSSKLWVRSYAPPIAPFLGRSPGQLFWMGLIGSAVACLGPSPEALTLTRLRGIPGDLW